MFLRACFVSQYMLILQYFVQIFQIIVIFFCNAANILRFVIILFVWDIQPKAQGDLQRVIISRRHLGAVLLSFSTLCVRYENRKC